MCDAPDCILYPLKITFNRRHRKRWSRQGGRMSVQVRNRRVLNEELRGLFQHGCPAIGPKGKRWLPGA